MNWFTYAVLSVPSGRVVAEIVVIGPGLPSSRLRVGWSAKDGRRDRENKNERVVKVDFMAKNGVPAMAGKRIHGLAPGALVRNGRKGGSGIRPRAVTRE
jgi:hypothetical protein